MVEFALASNQADTLDEEHSWEIEQEQNNKGSIVPSNTEDSWDNVEFDPSFSLDSTANIIKEIEKKPIPSPQIGTTQKEELKKEKEKEVSPNPPLSPKKIEKKETVKDEKETVKETIKEKEEKISFPLPIRNVELVNVKGQIYNQDTLDLHEKILNALIASSESRLDRLNFLNKNFIIELAHLFSDENVGKGLSENLESYHGMFWYDMERLFLKWMLNMRENFADNDQEMRLLMEDVRIFIKLAHSKEWGRDCPSFFNALVKDVIDFSTSQALMKYELADNNAKISLLFANAVSDFYGQHKADSTTRCSMLRNKHFDGHFSKYPLLEYTILKYDPQEEMRKCFDPSKLKLFPKVMIAKKSISSFINTLKSRGPEEYEDFFIEFMYDPSVKLFMETDRSFEINRSFELVILLRRLNYLKLLKSKPLSKFIKLAFKDSKYQYQCKWNADTFKEFLDDVKEKELIEEQEYIDYLNLKK